MTLTDPRLHAVEPISDSQDRPAPRIPLVEQLRGGTSYAVAFGGQGGPWLESLDRLVRTHALEDWMRHVTETARARLVPVEDELLRAGAEFDPAAWLTDGDAVEANEDAEASSPRDQRLDPAWSVPGILLTQAGAVRALSDLGLDPASAPPVAVLGHSQGVLASALLAGSDHVGDEVDLLVLARLIGAAVQVVARRRGVLGDCMLAVTGARPGRVEEIIDALPASLRLHVGLRNGRDRLVVCGPEASLAAFTDHCTQLAEREAEDRAAKRTGGAPFAVETEALPIRAAFHHPDLAEVPGLVGEWAERCGLDREVAAEMAHRAVVAPVDWVAELDATVAQGAEWLLDLGPSDLVTRISAGTLAGTGVGQVAVTTTSGTAALTRSGGAPRVARPWSDFAPRPVTLPDGSTRLETRFTRLTGRSPVLLAGMTPTTVDAAIVAAAANAGFWAELAGGGQVTEQIFTDRVDELEGMLVDGATWQLNTLLLDPYLWGLQVGSKRLLQRARVAGAAVDGLVVSAGIPEVEDAVRLLDELAEVGVTHVAFKPGTRAQVQQVLAIADAVAPRPVVMQLEGGHAGGHHSWEDLDELLLATYAKVRAHANVTLCVGGGIGTPQRAADYLTGTWAHAHGHPAMPADAILVGTAAMATLEATTSPAVKQLLVDTPGTDGWVGAGRVAGGVTSGRSQLGADIHEVDNAASRTGRLLDEVAGDAEAVAERRKEIVEALRHTAKPFFGELTEMTYGSVLDRFVELTATPEWGDVTWRDRFHELVQRAEARLHEDDHGLVPTLAPTTDDVADAAAVLDRLRESYPALDQARLHPADVHHFLEVCARPGKPVPFVPVVDADVRRWYRSDSLWQAHDPRFDADRVCVIPGPVSVAGIDRVDEPVADLLQRFEDAATDRLLQQGLHPVAVPGRRRLDVDHGPVGAVLAAPDVRWAERTVTNPVQRLGEGWVVLSAGLAEHPCSGARLVAEDDRVAVLHVPGAGIRLRIEVAPDVALGATPRVLDPAEAMREVVRTAAGGDLPPVTGGSTSQRVRWSPDHAADHSGVTAASGSGAPAPDALVGLVWPAVFAVVAQARTASGQDVVEGMLDLVHLDHALTVLDPAGLPRADRDLLVSATSEGVADTEAGRVLTVSVTVTDAATDEPLARLTERFAVRGRTGTVALVDPHTAGGALEETDVRDAPRLTVATATVDAPRDLRPFAAVTGDHNPIHTDAAAARLAGLGDPIVHGMWLSAAVQHVLGAERVQGWTIRFLAPVRPGVAVHVSATRVGVSAGREVVEVTLRTDDEVVGSASAVLAAPVTAYVFPGQGIQHQGMGMDGYARCAEAREVWDRADRHTRSALGFSVLEVVRENPTELAVGAEVFRHPDGVLFLTQFTQVAMAVLGAAQVAEMREAGVLVEDALIAGHSVGEYNALAAVSGVIPLEAVIEVVFQRGTVMHGLVPRDEQGRSDYRLAAMRPDQCGIPDDEVTAYVDRVAEESGEFLQVVNLNLRGSQYAVAGTVAGLDALEARLEEARAARGGRRCFIVIPGIDVPFHSAVLRGGVPEFRDHLDALLPEHVDPGVLVGRYVPNLVPRVFSLDESFVREVAAYVDSEPLAEVLADWDRWSAAPTRLCRRLLVELLAWQFASPVRWIETQDLMFTRRELGGLGVERLVEVGVATSPVLANLASGTLTKTGATAGEVRVLNVGRDADAVFARDEEPPAPDVPHDLAPAEPAPVAPDGAAEQTLPPKPVTPAGRGEQPADLPFGPGDAVGALLAVATKVRPEQLAGTDTIESLCDGASSRRNQILLDLGTELGLGAIDGAAEAALPDLTDQVATLARGYRPFGPVLQTAVTDLLTGALGPAGARPATVADRVSGHWALDGGWTQHVLVELALGSRSGASVRGGELGRSDDLASADDVARAVDEAVASVAARHGVDVSPPAAEASTEIDPAALAGLTESLTGPDGALATTARHLLRALGHERTADVTQDPDGSEDAAVVAHVTRELGSDWVRATTPTFDPRRAVLLDDRWASAREDVARIALGQDGPDAQACFTGAGDAVAGQARWWADHLTAQGGRGETVDRLRHIAEDAVDDDPGTYSDQVAVVTGAGRDSIAEAVVARLLAGGATVVATTSRLDHARLRHLRSLYRRHARAGAALWVAPVNVASWADVDAFTTWLLEEQTRTVRGASVVTKPALQPTLLLPFAAGPVSGELTAVSGRTEVDARLLLWSTHRLLAGLLEDRPASARRLHVVLPGSPNRGLFGGDGGYGEMKAALDATVARWHAEPGWAAKVSLVHAVIGWVRGTGLMGAHDPLAAAVEESGVRTHTPGEMAGLLLDALSEQSRRATPAEPLTVDLTGGLGDSRLDLRALARSAEAAPAPGTSAPERGAVVPALPAPPELGVAVPRLPSWPDTGETRPEDLVVIVGAAELGPYGASRTRQEIEVDDRLSAAGVLELAWSTGLITWQADGRGAGWVDTASGDPVPEHEIHERYHDEVVARCGIRPLEDDGALVDGTAPLLASVHLEEDLTFSVAGEAEARAMAEADPQRTTVEPRPDGSWAVTRLAGTQIRVPRRSRLSRRVGGQLPTGFDPTTWGIPAEMVESVDRVAVWNLVCTVDAFLSSGFTPAELLRWVHPAHVANTQGTGIGGMRSMRSLYVDTLLGATTQNDILQEALPNVIAAHVAQSWVGGYGAMAHPVAACATTAVSVEEGVDKIRLGKAQFVVAGGFDDLGVEGVIGFGAMSATAETDAMRAQGIEDRHTSRANDRRHGGFVESQGGGTLLLARGDVAARAGLPVLGVVAYAASFSDGLHTSIPAPGLGALAAGLGGAGSPLARGLAQVGLGPDDVSVLSKHDTSTGVNERNESELHERLATAIGRDADNPLFVVSQKSLTGHSKGGAAAFQLAGLCQVLATGVVPPNRSLDCVDDTLAPHRRLVWLREPLATTGLRAGLVTSLGFGHVAGVVAVAHPEAFVATLDDAQRETWVAAATERLREGRRRLSTAMHGGDPLYRRTQGRRLGDDPDRELEATLLTDADVRLGADGVYAVPEAVR